MINTDAQLLDFVPTIRLADWVAVDTEADSLHAYPEKICLIQISTAAGDRLIDPLATINLNPLFVALSAHQLIMHGADYDLRLFRRHHEFVPGSIFDTMLAARLLGHRQFGLSHLVELYLGAKLEKGPQKANWARRPLTERMTSYARHDTHYLKDLADKLQKELKSRKRLAWHAESCDRLIKDSSRLTPPDEDTVWRVKGCHTLTRSGLAVVREIWRWRETEAIMANKPPFFILRHEDVVAIAGAAVAHKSLESRIPKHLSPRRRSGLEKAVQHALHLPADKHPHHPSRNGRWPTEAEKKRYGEIERRRDRAARELEIDPTLIASRSTLADLSRDWDKHAGELMAWQRDLLKA